MMSEDWTDVAHGIKVPCPVADFIFSRLQWIRSGEVESFQVPPPPGWDSNDLCTGAFLLSNEDFSSARVLFENLPPPPMFINPSSTLLKESFNNNHLKRNPFKARRKRRKKGTRDDGEEGQEQPGNKIAGDDCSSDSNCSDKTNTGGIISGTRAQVSSNS